MTEAEQRRQDEDALLDSLRRSLEIGCSTILKNKSARFGAELEESANPEVRAEYSRIIAEAEIALQVEAVHKQGILIKLDHPVVIDLIGQRYRREPAVISTEEIEAAKRYKLLTTQSARV
jgi:hypothetical protein